MRFFETREEFLESKKKTLGASEVQTILGLSTNETRYGLWKRKIDGTVNEYNKFMEAGHMMEEPVLKRFYKKRGKDFTMSKDMLCYSHPQYNFIVVHPDDIYEHERLIEVKSTQKYLTESNIDMHVLNAYFTQWNFTLGIILENEPEFLTSGFVVTISRGVDYFETVLGFDEELYHTSLAAVLEFKRLIDQNIAPGLAPEDYNTVWKLSNGESVMADDRMTNIYDTLCLIIKQERELDAEKQELISAIKAELKEKEKLIDPNTNRLMVTWKTTARGRIFRVYE